MFRGIFKPLDLCLKYSTSHYIYTFLLRFTLPRVWCSSSLIHWNNLRLFSQKCVCSLLCFVEWETRKKHYAKEERRLPFYKSDFWKIATTVKNNITFLKLLFPYSRLPITRTFKENKNKVLVIRGSKQIARRKGKTSFLLYTKHFDHI